MVSLNYSKNNFRSRFNIKVNLIFDSSNINSIINTNYLFFYFKLHLSNHKSNYSTLKLIILIID